MKKSKTVQQSSIYPLLILEEILPHRRRHRLMRVLGIFVLILIAIFAAMYFGLPYLDALPYAYILGGVLIVTPLWLFVVALEFFYRSLFFRNMARQDEMDVPVLRLCYDARSGDLLETFLVAPIGRHLMRRLEIPDDAVDAFCAAHPDKRIPLAALQEAEVRSLSDLAAYFFDTSEAFREFLFSHGVQEKLYKQASNWITTLYYRAIMHEQWWTKNRLKRIDGIATAWTYGHAYILRRYGQEIFATASLGHTSYGAYVDATEAALAKSQEANVLLVGEYQDGLYDVVYDLTQKIHNVETVSNLHNKRVVQIDTAFLISATADRVSLEREFAEILSQSAHAGNIILVLENMPQFLRNATSIGADVRSILARYLGSARFQVIGLAETGGYHDTIRAMNDVMTFFEVVFVKEASERATTSLLGDIALSLESHHDVFISYTAMQQAAHAARQYFQEGSTEDKAKDVLVESISYAQQQGTQIIDAALINNLVERKTDVPVGTLERAEKEKLLNLESLLHERVIGQEEAVRLVSNTIRRLRAGVRDDTKPIGTFLFLGPTGVGKTETAKSLAAVFFNDEEAMMRLDMSEYVGVDALERLIGSFEQGKPGVLSSMLREKQYGVILLDEFEKTSPEVLNLFLQIFDEGFFSDMDGSRVNARNIIFIATSNAGSGMIWEAFQQGKQDVTLLKEEIIDHVIAEGTYRPELLNRFDGVVIFHPLDETHLRKIAKLMIEKFARRTKEKGYRVEVSDDALEYLISYGTDPAFGARPMARAIREKAEQVVAKKILADAVAVGDTISITRADLERA